MTYDLRRLRLAGLIRRIRGTNHYVLTPEGIRAELRHARRTIGQHVENYITRARLSRAA